MVLSRCFRAAAPGALLVALALPSTALVAGTWDVVPRVSINQIYSDNINLAPKGDEDSEWVTRLDAGVGLLREGPRTRARIGYNLVGLAYWEDSDENDVFHQLDANGRAIFVPERLFVEAAASYDQRLRTRDGRTGDLVNLGVDRTDVFRFQVTPVYVQQFEDWATGELRYTYDRVDYAEPDARDTDSERNRVLARLDSGPVFSTFGWSFSFDWSETDFDDGSSVTFQTAEALGRWNVTERFSLFGAVGDERNTFEQDPRRARPDDTFWRAGGTFEPASRTLVEGFFGERFFGTTYGGALRHRIRDGNLFADYNEELRTANEINVAPIRDADGELIFDGETGRPIFELPDVRSGVFLSKRLSAGLTLRRPKTRIGLRAYDESREYEVTDRSERAKGVIGDISWRVQPRTEIFLFARFEETTFEDQRDRKDKLLTSRIGVSRDLGQNMAATLEYGYRERDSTESFRDYTENRLTATLTKTF